MLTRHLRVPTFLAAMFLLAIGCRPRPAGETPPPLSIVIDATLAPVPGVLPDDGKRGPRPVAAIRDDAGVVTEFIANEVVIVPRSQAELNDFVSRYKGAVIGDNSVPAPPPQLGKTLDPAAAQATEYLVRIDPSGVDYSNLNGLAGRKLGGSHTVSSELGARLLAVTVRESANGLSVSPNFSLTTQAVVRSTRERPNGGGFDDAFNTSQFQSGGSRSGVTAAWQWVAAHGITRRMQIAIIDGGFWLNALGQPLTAAGGTDLPAAPVQYDFVGDDFIAGAMNPAACSSGSACPWHGNGSAGVAAGIVNNSAVAAGTGGTVADPWLFHTDVRDRVQRDRAVRTAVAWGADIISMSFGGPCNYACRSFERDHDTDRGYREAIGRGIVLVSSAGNDTKDVGDDNFYHPCITDGVICVGSLQDNGNTAAGFSNYGSGVDIWAPTNIPALTRGTTAPIFTTFGGTSASAPFVAGVVGMIKAINPALTSDQTNALLRDTAWSDSADGKVSRYLNALEAVKRASNYVLPPDRFEPNNNSATAKPIAVGQNDNLTLHDAADRDFYLLTVAGQATVTLTNTYSDDIGKPNLLFSKTDDCGGATQISKTTQANQRSWTYSATTGQYWIQVSSGRALPYDLGITSNAAPLSRDSFEGAPNNDAFSRAFSLGKGGSMYPATIFPAGDVDFYRVQSTGSIFNPKVGGKLFSVAIVVADMPVSLDLFDDHQNMVSSTSSSADCKSLPSLTLPTGNFFVRVRAASPGSYTLAVGERHESGVLYDMRSLWRLLKDPAGPVEFVVLGPYERFAFERGEERAAAIEVVGSGLHATLIDSAGNIIAEGQSLPNNTQGGERIALEGTVPGESYVVKLERDIDVTPGKGMRLPRVNAKLSFAPR